MEKSSSRNPNRDPSPPMTDEEAREIVQRIKDLGGSGAVISTGRLIVGKLSDQLRRLTLVFQIIIGIIGSLSGLCGAIITPLHVEIPSSLTTVLFVLAGISSACEIGIPKLIDFIKQFSGRTFLEEFPRWVKVSQKFYDESSLGDIQSDVLSMFAFIRPERDVRDNDLRRTQIKAMNHFLSTLQCCQTMNQFIEAYNIVMPVFRIASTYQFISVSNI